MANWAAEHADRTITQLNQIDPSSRLPFYQPYVDNMCFEGYTGPLCGACMDGFGHSGQRCVKCVHRSTNSFFYFLVCLFMFIMPALQTLLHSKNVQKRHHFQRLGTAPRFGRAQSGPQESIRRGSRRNWVVERVPEEIDDAPTNKNIQMVPVKDQQQLGGIGIGSPVSDVQRPAHPDQVGVVRSLTPYVSGELPPTQANLAAAAATNGSDTIGGLDRAVSTDEVSTGSLGPFSGPGAAPDVLRQHSSEQQLPIPAAAVVAAAAAAASAQQQSLQQPLRSRPSSLIAHLFNTEPLDRTPSVSPWAVDPQSMTAPRPPKVAPVKPVDAVLAVGAAVGPAAALATADALKPKFYHTDVMTVSAS